VQNAQNVGLLRTNTSGYKGVTMQRRSGRWIAQIVHNHKRQYLGTFAKVEDAAEAYRQAAHPARVRVRPPFAPCVGVYTPAMQVTLSSGEVVHLRPLEAEGRQGVYPRPQAGLLLPQGRRDRRPGHYEEVPANNFDLAWDAVLPLMVERVEKDGTGSPYTDAWRDDLDPGDSDKLEGAILEIKLPPKAAGEKNPWRNCVTTSNARWGRPPPPPEEYEDFRAVRDAGLLPRGPGRTGRGHLPAVAAVSESEAGGGPGAQRSSRAFYGLRDRVVCW